MDLLWPRLLAIVLVGSLAGFTSLALQTPPQSVNAGVYTEQQATRGQAISRARCASCHGNTLGGQSGPPLAGDDFLSSWSTQPLLELANKIRRTMPKDNTPRLTAQETADVLAYILQTGKFPAGRTELAMDDAALKQCAFPAQAVAPPKASVAAQLPSLPSAGNVAQV